MPKRQTLDRLLSKLGIASRGKSAEWIRAGRVRVNGKIIREPDAWISWPQDQVSIDKKPIQKSQGLFFMLHKPAGYITTHSDERGRATIFDLLPQDLGFIHAVGRLDKATSGLLLITNDSGLSSFLTDPESAIPRIYQATVWGEFTEEKIQLAKAGVLDAGERLKCQSAKILKITKRETLLEVVLTQGKNREVRRLFKALGHTVTNLHRLEYGPFQLGDLPKGKYKQIPFEEAKRLLGKKQN